MVVTSLKDLFDFSCVGCSPLTFMHISCLVMLNCVLSWQLFFSQFHGPLYEYLSFVIVCYYVHYFETVVSNESDGSILCQVEVLCSIFCPFGKLAKLNCT